MKDILEKLELTSPYTGVSTGLNCWSGNGEKIVVDSPVDGNELGSLNMASPDDFEKALAASREAFEEWRKVPAQPGGEVVRQFGEALRAHKADLGALVSYEMGKSLQEGLGEVQEMIDICDFAVGLSRQLYGLQMHSERSMHRMMEQWHPLGVVGIISAFNFPVAVWAWNATIAWICGNTCIWKPSEKAPFSALACQEIFKKVIKDNDLPEGLSCVVVGDSTIGSRMAGHKDIRWFPLQVLPEWAKV